MKARSFTKGGRGKIGKAVKHVKYTLTYYTSYLYSCKVLALKIARLFGKPVEEIFQLEEGK